MAKRILQKVSFGLTRTNPKLSTNIKIVVDSTDNIFLESFDEVEELSDSRFKGYKVSGGSYAQDLYRFYDKGKFPKEIAYSPVIKDNSQSIKKNFSEQYDVTYSSGAYTKISKLYDEEFAMFAPLWIEPLNIPDYFIIFKNPDPVSVNTVGATAESQFDSLVGITSLYDNVVSRSKIHAVIDLTPNSNIGRYIRRHAADELFPESPLKVNFKRNEFTQWNGISMDRGEITSKSVFFHEDLLIRDKTIMEMENLITNGFQSNGIVCANLLNLEFLFNDVEAENYEINRYFGFYCNAEDVGKFKLDGDALFEDRVAEETQLPIPFYNTVGHEDNLETQVQTNEKGIKIYANVIDGILPRKEYFNDSDHPRFGFVKDKNGKLYSVKNGGDWKDDEEIRIDDVQVDWQDFTGFADSVDVVSARHPDEIGRPHSIIEIVDNPNSGDQIRFRYAPTTEFGYTSNSELIETHTIVADSSLAAGTVDNRNYSSNGSVEQVALAIRKAINNIVMLDGEKEIFRAVEKGSKVIVYSRFVNSLWNKITLQSYKTSTQDTIFLYGENGLESYTSAVGASYAPTTAPPITYAGSGLLSSTKFAGGNDYIYSRVIVDVDNEEAFTKDRYLKTENGYSKIKAVHHYIEEPVFDKIGLDFKDFKNFEKYKVIEIEDDGQRISLNSSKKVTLYETVENGAGFLTFYPVKDFDFDFHNDDYTKDADADTNALLDYLATQLGGTGATAYKVVNSLIGPTSEWQTDNGFVRLVGVVDEDTGEVGIDVENEYDRLKENENKFLALESRVVPFVNKWVYDDFGKDVRENGYRLNVSEAFRYSNFSPSFKHFTPDPKFYTHEWYYLQQYPTYMDAEEKAYAFSYFDTELDIQELYDVTEDKFVDYFAQDNIGTQDFPTKFKYSLFANGDDVNYAETFFRGVKVKVAERADFTQDIDFNINDIRTKASDKFNNYKFSAVLAFEQDSAVTYRVIKNEKFKNITLVVGVNLFDDLYLPGITGPTANRFMDRTMLYTMIHKYDINKLDAVGEIFDADEDVYSDVVISGAFELYPSVTPFPGPQLAAIDPGTGYYVVNAIQNTVDGSQPNLISDMTPGVGGKYQDIEIILSNSPADPTDGIVRFKNIIEVNQSSIICEEITFESAFGGGESPMPFTHTGVNPWTTKTSKFNPTYKGGGFNAHRQKMTDISFASIADKINRGDPAIEYITVDVNGATGPADDFIIELLEPEQELKVTTFGVDDDEDRPTIFSTSSDSIGSKTKFLRRSYVAPITRYNGNYSPRVYDVLLYTNDVTHFRTNLINQYNEVGATADVDDIIDNVTFGIDQRGFGQIRNLYYNKVNERNPKAILELDRTGGFAPVYPKINEIAIDYSDFDIFKSNWDSGYFVENTNKSTTESRMGTRSMLEKRSYFGSKIMNLPDEIQLETFDPISIDDPVIGGRELFLPSSEEYDAVYRLITSGKNATLTGNIGRSKRELAFKPITNPSKAEFWIYVEKALEKYLIGDGITTVFSDFINPAYSVGLKDSITDDVKEYIKLNILKMYEIKDIELFELRYWKNPNNFELIEFGLDDADRKVYNFNSIKNFETANLTNSGLNFKLIYNIPAEKKSSTISLKVTLKKK